MPSPTAFPDDVVRAVCAHMDDDHAEDGLLICRVLGGVPHATAVTTTGVDGAGIDFLARTPDGPVAVRVGFAEPATERAHLRLAVVALHERARLQAPPA